MRNAQFDDLERCVDLFNIYSQFYLGVNEASTEDITTEWTSPGFSPIEDIRLITNPQGDLVGYIEVWTNREPPVHPWVWVTVHPDYNDYGIGEKLLDWAVIRSKQAFDRVPDGARVSIQTGTVSTIEPAKQLFDRMGLNLIRHSFRMQIEMGQPPQEPHWPEGIVLKSYDPDRDLEAVYRANDRAFQDHFGYIKQPFEKGFKRFKHYMTSGDAYDPALWFLAIDGQQIAGICLCSRWAHDDPDCGYVNSLAVGRPWRKRGIALALLQHAFKVFYERGTRKVGLGVDAENLTGALRLYEKAGMSVYRQFELYEKEIRPGAEISVQALDD